MFGQPSETSRPTTTIATTPTVAVRPSRHQRRISFDRELPTSARLHSPSPSRSGAVSAADSVTTEGSQPNLASPSSAVSRPPLSRYQRPSQSHLTSPTSTSKRQPSLKQGEAFGPSTPVERPRDSFSSNGSWIRRLSLRPLSQHGSVRSSIGPDSPSITFSHGSSAPILPRPSTGAAPLPPNKLVKRSSSIQREPSGISGGGSRLKAHLPSLRRPATSHQRSATLHQIRTNVDINNPPTPPKYSFEQQIRPETSAGPASIEQARGSRKKFGWISFFHSKTASIGGRSGHNRLVDVGPQAPSSSTRRICLDNDEQQKVHLVKARMVSTSSAPATLSSLPDRQETPRQLVAGKMGMSEKSSPAALPTTPSKQAKRSLSMSFSSPSSWVSRTSGSLRRPKRGADADSRPGSDRRHVSAPIAGGRGPLLQRTVDRQDSRAPGPVPSPQTSPRPSPNPAPWVGSASLKQAPTAGSAAITGAQLPALPVHKRTLTSPLSLSPLPRNPSFQAAADPPRAGSFGGAAATVAPRLNQPSGSSTSSASMSQLRVPSHERSSIMEGSETDTRGFTSGDDDDTDFKSDTMFDSLRTVASGRMRAVETPLESVYDESPPSTAGGNGTTSRTKRLSIHEILGRSWEYDDRIMEEEDENAATPVQFPVHAETTYPAHLTHYTHLTPAHLRLSADSSSRNGVSLLPRDFGRLSLDDDFDEDWTKDDDAPFNALSPPSKSSSLNSRGINANVRLALANLGENHHTVDMNGHMSRSSDRPLSTLFDWSEPIALDKQDVDGKQLRPQTAHAKQEIDSRGGRSAIRKGPMPTHVRSQSVPVVHDASDDPKAGNSKYGTWGMGTKAVSEDWDEDFEFSSNDNSAGKGNEHLFAVPESIRATQPSVKAHSGQIRELSLLVNDLKRLCRHGRDMNMLEGPQKTLWKEAEGIIALASPDEEDMMEDHETTSSFNLDSFEDALEQPIDDDIDATSLNMIDAAFDGQEPAMSKMAVVRERQSSKRRSVFSPDDDIFGCNWPVTDENYLQSTRSSRPRTPEGRLNSKPGDVTGVVARSVLEAMHRSISGPIHTETRPNNKMHFDTNSLRVLVRRAGELRDTLSDIVRRAEQITQSPARTPRHERRLDSSPAFTRVFDDPGSSPQRRPIRSRGNTSLLDGPSPDNSPSSPMARRLQTMTVG